MTNHSENNKRIAKNTLMLYCRMLFSMLVSLYTSRVILDALGVEDFGIQNVVGGFVSMFSLISSSLSSSVGRFLTFELGTGDSESLKKVFSTSVLIHIVLAIIVLVLSETLGVWFLNNKMVIPENRIYAANWVFHASILTFILGLLSVPYNALIVAHERMSAFAYIGVLEIVLKLVIVLFIAYCPLEFDRLIVCSFLLMGLSVLMRYIYVSYCRRNFDESKIRITFDKKYWKEISAFSAWNFIGCSALLLKNQGVDILLNMFFGPVVNAARGIATTVNGAISKFSGNFMTALIPQITKSYASQDLQYSYSLVQRGSRFSFYIMIFFAFPIIFETEFILDLWLKQYPEHSVNFVRLILILSIFENLSRTLVVLLSATGKIRNYQLVVGIVSLLNFPICYMVLTLGTMPEIVFLIAIFIECCCLILRLIFLKKMLGFSIKNYLENVLWNIFKVSFFIIVPTLIVYKFMPQPSWTNFLVVIFVNIISSLIAVFYFGCSINEREFVLTKVCEGFRKVFSIYKING